MHAACLALLATFGSVRVSADEQAYQKARRAFYELKADRELRKDRGHWLGAASRFEAVATRYPKSARAAEALFTAAELRSELSRLSFVAADRQEALADYRRVAKGYPDSALADDALFQAARMELDRENDPEAARVDLERLLEGYAHGDMVRRAKALLATLGPEPRVKARKKGGERASRPALKEVAEDDGEESATDGEESGDPSPQPSPTLTLGRRSASQTATTPTATPTDSTGTNSTGTNSTTARRGSLSREAGEGRGEGSPTAAAAPTSTPLLALRKAGATPGGVPLSVQMGLAIHRVVIDAGHGGHDTGAIGPGGTLEKDVTLAIARKLARELEAKGLTVLLTRDGDRSVTLEQRAQFANEHKADLFVSIHANANADRRQKGVETYFLNVTDDRYAIRLAARENQSSERSISDLQLILADLATKSNVEESHQLAERVQRSLVDDLDSRRLRERDLGVKHALFYVLLGVKMPAILVESAFVSNPTEEKRLGNATFQGQVARDIAAGVLRFVRDCRELAGL